MAQWNFEWITDWKTIWSDSFQGQWREWLAQSWSSHVFFHPTIAKAWVETYMPLWDIRPIFIIARKETTTVFFPLVLWRKNWKNAFLREIIPIGFSDFDYHDPIIVGKDEVYYTDGFWLNLIEELSHLGLSYDSVNITGIRAGAAGRGQNWYGDEVAPYCDISRFTTPDEFLPTLKKSLRGDLRRQIRRLQDQGELTYHVYSPDSLSECLEILPQFLGFHSKRWPRAYKAPYLHKNLLQQALKRSIVHFSELQIDGKPISWHFGFVDSYKFYYYLPAIDPAFATLSPGKVHLLKCVEEAIRLKLSVFDHLRGEESYKSGWTNELEKLSKFSIKQDRVLSRIKIFMVENIK